MNEDEWMKKNEDEWREEEDDKRRWQRGHVVNASHMLLYKCINDVPVFHIPSSHSSHMCEAFLKCVGHKSTNI